MKQKIHGLSVVLFFQLRRDGVNSLHCLLSRLYCMLGLLLEAMTVNAKGGGVSSRVQPVPQWATVVSTYDPFSTLLAVMHLWMDCRSIQPYAGTLHERWGALSDCRYRARWRSQRASCWRS